MDNLVEGGQGLSSQGYYGTIAGGYANTVGHDVTTYSYQFVGGGYGNVAVTNYASVLGGQYNMAGGAGNDYPSVLGGLGNTASGFYASVLGGKDNTASGTASVAAGYHAQANQNGCFVFADDSSSTNQTCTAANSFVVRATGGVRFIYDSGGDYVYPSGGNWVWGSSSDENIKHDIAEVDPRAVLESVVSMPVATWKYNADGDGTSHIGPMAQDFAAAFHLSKDDKHINTLDEAGVAIGAIQGLHAEVLQRDEKIAALERSNAEANQKVAALEQRLAAIEARLGITQ